MNQSKKSAEEDYIKTPISVLKYIGELEAKFSSDSIEQIVLEVLEKEKGRIMVNGDVKEGFYIVFSDNFPSVAKQVAERLTDDT